MEIEKLKHQLGGHRRHRFGAKSETADQLDLQLQLEEEEAAAARITSPDAKGDVEQKIKPKCKPLPPELPRFEEVLFPGEECACGGKLRTIGEDVTEEHGDPRGRAGARDTRRRAAPEHDDPHQLHRRLLDA